MSQQEKSTFRSYTKEELHNLLTKLELPVKSKTTKKAMVEILDDFVEKHPEELDNIEKSYKLKKMKMMMMMKMMIL